MTTEQTGLPPDQSAEQASRRIDWVKHLAWVGSLRHIIVISLRIFSYSSLRDRIFLVISLTASICAGIILPLMNIIFANLVNTFTSLTATSPDDVQAAFMRSINQYVLYTVYLFVGRFILAYIAILGFRMVSLRISAAIRLSYLQALFKQPISVHDALPPGQTASIVTITANILQIGISERLSTLIQAITVTVTALIISFCYSWSLSLVTSSGLVVIFLCYVLMTPIVVKRYQAIQNKDRHAAGIVSEAVSSIRMIAACGAEEKMVDRYNVLVEESKVLGHQMSPIIALQHSPIFFSVYATFALCFWFAVKLYLNNQFPNIQTLIVVLMCVMTILGHVNAIAVPLLAASHAIQAAEIFFTIIDAPKPATGGMKDHEILDHNDIVFQDVSFAYPSRSSVKVLEGLSLRIRAGKTTAIVGPSGSGKSTIVGLLERWYELNGDTISNPVALNLRNGTIKIDRRDLHEIDLQYWRSQIGLVQQEPFLFNDTIFKNVEYGLVGTQWENAAQVVRKHLVEQACREAYAEEFILSFDEGYNTKTGDGGIKLSGGQRQRIAIARSIVRQPKLLILDEATSSLDTSSEKIVQAALDNVSQYRTTLIIAHRLSTIMKADHIVVFAKGKAVQEGTHQQLLAEQGGLYWKLVTAQHLALEAEQPSNYNCPMKTETLNEKISPLQEAFSEPVLSLEETLSAQSSPDRESFEALLDLPEIQPDKALPEENNSKSVLRSFGMLLSEQRENWTRYLVLLVVALGAASSYPTQAYIFAKFVTSFAYSRERLLASTNFLCLMLMAIAFVVGSSYFALGWTSNSVSVRTTALYRREYFRNVISKRISFFDDENNALGKITARIASDPIQLQQLLGFNLVMVLISVFNAIGCVAVSIYFGWKYALVITGASMPIIILGSYYRVRYEVKFEAESNGIFAESTKFATEAIRAIRTVASLTLESTICKEYDTLLRRHIRMSFLAARFSALIFAASDSIVLLCMAFALWYGGTLLASYEYSPFKFLVIYNAIIQGSMAAGQWLSLGPGEFRKTHLVRAANYDAFKDIASVTAAANRICNMRLREPDYNTSVPKDDEFEYQEDQSYAKEKGLKGAEIEFRNISFQYPTRKISVLNNLSLAIKRGQFAAIVGPSGSGKTTIISLLERFYEPQRGMILCDSNDIKQHRKAMSLVTQEPHLFRGTLRDNILLGVDPETITEEALHKICRDAGIHTYISSLPEGYDTNIGNSGVALSGGQKQRISIARALIRNPEVLLLDEATSNLDSETEKEMQGVFEQASKGRTTIVVAHRLETIQNADIIFVIRNGTVEEKGDHNSLLMQRGLYYKMCQAQALNT